VVEGDASELQFTQCDAIVWANIRTGFSQTVAGLHGRHFC